LAAGVILLSACIARNGNEVMKALLLSASLFLMASAAMATDKSDAEQDLLRIRQGMADDFAAALPKENSGQR
jgi:hypothetical protein